MRNGSFSTKIRRNYLSEVVIQIQNFCQYKKIKKKIMFLAAVTLGYHDYKIGIFTFEGTVNSKVYCNIIKKIKQKLATLNKRQKHFILVHDRAKPHVSNFTRNFINNIGWDIVLQPPCSPDLNPLDVGIWNSMEHRLKFKRKNTKNSLQRAVVDTWNNLPPESVKSTIELIKQNCIEIEKLGGVNYYKD